MNLIDEPFDSDKWARNILHVIRRQPYVGEKVDWYGQDTLMKQIRPFLSSPDPFPHTILLGEPGLGKTHLARYIASERNEVFEEMLAPVNPMALPTRGVVLLDEIHRQRSPELLFETMKHEAPTIIAATTKPEMIDRAFRSRFFLELQIKRYEAKAMTELIRNNSTFSDETLDMLGTAAAGNPRQALRLALVGKRLETDDPEEILSACQITGDGLTLAHIEYLRLLVRLKKPVGLSQAVTLLYADEISVKMVERLLLEFDLVQLHQAGRTITRAGLDWIKAFDEHD